MATERFEVEVGGKPLVVEVGKLAGQADGACTLTYGGTVVLATAVMSDEIREGIDYFPLLVDYEERLYAAGKIKGSRFIKREGRPPDEAILTSRMVDRSIRPLFDQSTRHDVQVVITVLSHDAENDPDILSLLAASTSLAISPIPWSGPIGAVRVGRVGGEWVLNPTYAAREKSDLDLVLAATEEKAIMIETGAKEVPEADILAAIEFGQKHLRKTLAFIRDVQSKVGRQKAVIEIGEPSPEETSRKTMIEEKVKRFAKDGLAKIFAEKTKEGQQAKLTELKDEIEEKLKTDNDVSKDERRDGVALLDALYEDEARRLVLDEDTRVDGRKPDEIRPLSSEVGLLPRTHGSGLFQRGETQVLSVVTLGSPGDEQLIDTMEMFGRKRFMHHYNFPGFSTGEVAPIRSTGRREIGHGALAEKALLPVIPEKEQFPYTIRVVSEVLSSNGSTSQASICGSSLALMDGGVPIKAPVAGIAIGLITDEKDETRYKVLTDIQGVEDHNGDMDFKVAGTKDGITAIQMDVKLHGIPMAVVEEALKKAKVARLKILDVMAQTIPAPRPELSPFAPRILTIRIDPEKIREVIGRGGETINKLIEQCGGEEVTKIDIEDDGLIMVTSHQVDMAKRAIEAIENLTREVQIGEVYEGPVSRILKDQSGNEIGAIVDFLPGQDGMVHISEFANQRIGRVSDIVKVGDMLKVKVVDIDKERGRISLSVKALGDESTLVIPPTAFESGPPMGGFSGGRPAGWRGSPEGRPGRFERPRGGFGSDRGRRGPRRDDRPRSSIPYRGER